MEGDHATHTPGQAALWPGGHDLRDRGVLDGYGSTHLLVTSSTGSTLLDQQVELAGYSSFSFSIPTASEGDYLLVAQSTDQDSGTNQLVRAYAVPAPADLQTPVVTITSPVANSVITSDDPMTTIVVTGRATDDSGQVSVVVNGQVVTPTVAGEFSVPVEIRQGIDLISAVAQDAAGNIAFSAIVRVSVVPAPCPTRPRRSGATG